METHNDFGLYKFRQNGLSAKRSKTNFALQSSDNLVDKVVFSCSNISFNGDVIELFVIGVFQWEKLWNEPLLFRLYLPFELTIEKTDFFKLLDVPIQS